MNLYEQIFRRKSTRSYTGVPVEEETLDSIRAFLDAARPLNPHLRVRFEIVPRSRVRCLCPWTTPQLVAAYTEEREGALENVGFLLQQLDLYLCSLGLGSCWLGMGRMSDRSTEESPQPDGLKFAIMLAFGHPKGPHTRKNPSEFRRKSLSEISDRSDERLEPARLAPSSVNSQPWYFTHEGDVLHVYCVQKGRFGSRFLTDMNRIDIGIALAHLYAANPETSRFFRAESVPNLKGYQYMGSFSL